MFANVSELQTAILNSETRSFISHHIFEQTPFAFNQDRALWIEWKHILAHLIDVDPQDIVMTGSAAVGFSLNPNKDFKSFDLSSDFDCGVISSYYFDVAWRYLRNLRVSWLTLPSKSKEAINSHRKMHIFSGTIAADQVLSLLPFGQTWQAALNKMATIDPTRGREVKLRIYKDYDSLRYYQSIGIEKLRFSISESSDLRELELSATGGEIPIEDSK